MKISEILLNAKNKLKQENIDEREARLLLAYALGIRNEDLIRYDDIDDESVKKFNQILMERINHVPFAYYSFDDHIPELMSKKMYSGATASVSLMPTCR